MNYEAINNYIEKLPNNDGFMNLVEDEKIKTVFAAFEKLKDHYIESLITNRAIALQTLYMIEGEEEEYSKLKRHGVKSYSVKGVSVSLEGSGISPDVLNILGSNKAKVGRLI